MNHPSLTGIILVAQSQLGGAQLCFRFPFGNDCQSESIIKPKEEFTLPTKSALPVVIKRSDIDPFQLECSTLANLLCPTSSLCNQHFELIVDKTMFISYPSLFGKQTNEGISVADRRAASLSTFNFVLSIERNSNPSLIKMCSNIVKQLATVSQYEENRCGFLRSDIVRLLNVRENWSNKQTTTQFKERDSEQLHLDLLQTSSLARSMKQIYEELNEKGISHCSINEWPTLSLSLHDFEKHPKKPIRPYQTMLILENVDTFLAKLPRDSSLSIRTLVQASNPVKCFSQLQTETGVPLSQIYRIVAHLLYWKKVKIIDKLTKLNVYVLNPKKNMSSFLQLEEKFNEEFSNTSFREVNFREILTVFSAPRKLGENIEIIAQGRTQLRLQFVEAVSWFLRHDLLKSLHNYVILVIPLTEGSTITLKTNEDEKQLELDTQQTSEDQQKQQKQLRQQPLETNTNTNKISIINSLSTSSNEDNSNSINNNNNNNNNIKLNTNKINIINSLSSSSNEDNSNSSSNNNNIKLNISSTRLPLQNEDNSTSTSTTPRNTRSPTKTPLSSLTTSEDPPKSPKRRASLVPTSPISVNKTTTPKSPLAKSSSFIVSPSPSPTSTPSPSLLSLKRSMSHQINSQIHPERSKEKYALTPSPLAPEEELELSQYDDGSASFKLFKKLCPYFKGNHHYEEIMWRENINRDTLENIISTYEEILVVVQF